MSGEQRPRSSEVTDTLEDNAAAVTAGNGIGRVITMKGRHKTARAETVRPPDIIVSRADFINFGVEKLGKKRPWLTKIWRLWGNAFDVKKHPEVYKNWTGFSEHYHTALALEFQKHPSVDETLPWSYAEKESLDNLSVEKLEDTLQQIAESDAEHGLRGGLRAVLAYSDNPTQLKITGEVINFTTDFCQAKRLAQGQLSRRA